MAEISDRGAKSQQPSDTVACIVPRFTHQWQQVGQQSLYEPTVAPLVIACISLICHQDSDIRKKY